MGMKVEEVVDHTNKLEDYTCFTEEFKIFPELMPALQTCRPELLKLAARPLNKEETLILLNILRVFMETNQALREHSQDLLRKVRDITGNLRGLANSIHKLEDFAGFRQEIGLVPDEDV